MEKSVIFLKKLMTSEKIRYSNGWKVGCHNFLMFLCFCEFLSNLITIAQADKFWKWEAPDPSRTGTTEPQKP